MKKIVINDRIYGKFEITSPIILELILSKPVQRLKKISQMGPPNKYYHVKGYSRYEHSIAVMLLLKHLGASEEEQVAGLLHDISHTAFSHVIDWVFGSGHKEDFQDKQHVDFFLKTEVKEILKKYGFNPLKISQNKNFSFLDNELPDLCADRIDYSIKEFPFQIAKKCFIDLITYKNKIVFNNQSNAKLFAVNFLKRQEVHWGGYEAVARYYLFSRVLKFALDNKLIHLTDFNRDEEYILKKVESIEDKQIKKILQLLQKKDLSKLPKSKKTVQKKFRYVDPQFLKNGKLYRLSETDSEFKIKIELAKKDNKKGINTPIV